MVRDNEVKMALGMQGITCYSFNGDVLKEPWEVMDPNRRPFTCFKDFWDAHAASPPSPPLPAPASLPSVAHLSSNGALPNALSIADLGIMTPEEELSNSQLEYHWSPGSKSGKKLLKDFIEGRLAAFTHDRAKTDRNSTSRLSPYIHFGEISMRTVAAAAVNNSDADAPAINPRSIDDFMRQLGYREYSRYLSFHFPFTHERPLLEHLRAVPWRFDQSLFKAWRTGTTGFPLIDAGMREVWSTGWLHNRIRVVAASFMVKHLLLPWQWGLKHYWDVLLDADLECDALGWQYCSGCLVDGHDFSRLIDLSTESKRFDPKGNYVRRWLPILARLPDRYIHEPWTAPAEVLADAGVDLGVNYPWPVIDAEEAAAALEAAAAVVAEQQERLVQQQQVQGQREEGAPGVDGGQEHAAAVGLVVVKAEKEKQQQPTGTGTGTGTGTHANTAAMMTGYGPFRPGTKPDPRAAAKVWGPSSRLAHQQQPKMSYPEVQGYAQCGAALRRQTIANNANNNSFLYALSSNGDEDGYSEEVGSNLPGSKGEADLVKQAGSRCTASVCPPAVEWQQQQQQGREQPERSGEKASYLDVGSLDQRKNDAGGDHDTAPMIPAVGEECVLTENDVVMGADFEESISHDDESTDNDNDGHVMDSDSNLAVVCGASERDRVVRMGWDAAVATVEAKNGGGGGGRKVSKGSGSGSGANTTAAVHTDGGIDTEYEEVRVKREGGGQKRARSDSV